MADPDHPDPATPRPPETRPPSPSPSGPPGSPGQREAELGEDRFLLTAEKFIGTAMMFIGFINILLSISGGHEISVVPLLIYCGGLAIWAHATITNPTVRYLVAGAALVTGLAFLHYGEVLFWHKQLVFWGTVALVVFFMFRQSPDSP